MVDEMRWKIRVLLRKIFGNYRYGYMCTIDFDHELGEACGGNTIFPSLEDLKENHKCWKGCGVVKVKVYYVKTVVKQDLFSGRGEDESL